MNTRLCKILELMLPSLIMLSMSSLLIRSYKKLRISLFSYSYKLKIIPSVSSFFREMIIALSSYTFNMLMLLLKIRFLFKMSSLLWQIYISSSLMNNISPFVVMMKQLTPELIISYCLLMMSYVNNVWL